MYRFGFQVWAALGLLLSGLTLQSAHAQQLPVPPVRQVVDENGVDLLTGTFTGWQADIDIGPAGAGGLSYSRAHTSQNETYFYRANTDILLKFVEAWDAPDGNAYVAVTVGFTKDKFSQSGTSFTAMDGMGSTLAFDTPSQNYIYTQRDGTVIRFPAATADEDYDGIRALSVEQPNGLRLEYHNEKFTTSYCSAGCFITYNRVKSVTTNAGYQLKFEYQPDHVKPKSPTRVAVFNMKDAYCDPDADTCAATSGTPSVSYTWSQSPYDPVVGIVNLVTVVDAGGRTTRWTLPSHPELEAYGSGIGGIKSPSSTDDDTTIAYKYYGDGPFGSVTRVSSVTRRGLTWTYDILNYTSSQPTIKVTDPLGHTREVKSDLMTAQVMTDTDGLGRTVSYQYDSLGRRTRITYPEGNYVALTYDDRGNVTQTRSVAKSGSGLADVLTSATYPATCDNPKTCNKPTSTTDALGRVTDYSYDPAHGGIVTATLPEPTAGGVRPQARYTYSPQYAWYQNSAGALVQAATPVYKLIATSTCRTAASCEGTADEARTTYAYQAGSVSEGSNLLLTSTTSGAGDGSLSATASTSYDSIGNAVTVDGPLPGSADTVRTRYDILRRVVGMVGPDPDGDGARKSQATRYTYNLDGQVTKTERGTVDGQSDADWAGLAVVDTEDVGLDSAGRPRTRAITASGAIQALVQYSYDAAGRPECVAQRMNSAEYASLPESACTLGATGSFGPDRITKTIYDAANAVTLVQIGVGTGDQTDEVASTYSSNGKLLAVADGKGNTTTYQYDGFDRLWTTLFPSPTTPGTSSATDYEQLTLDAVGNVLSRRLRDGQTIGFAYDNLNRLTTKTLPGGEPAVNYSYDLLGQLTQVSRPADGIAGSFAYDALGRLTSDNQSFGSVSYQYDEAGRRTRITWQDGFFVTYDYDVMGAVTAIRENGAASGIGVLATYAYDDLGRRASVTRGNGTSTSYGYDSMSRLSSLTQAFTNPANDLTVGLSYNPASQIQSRTTSSDAYAWTGHVNVNRDYTTNGLNQYTLSGGVTLGYDGRGNLAASGSDSYTYSAENLLRTSSGGVSLHYDGLNRLHEYDSAESTRFLFDGGNIVAEIANPSGSVVRRYVPGPGVDEPIVWYEGADTADRRWLHADERGSVIAISDASGAVIATNSYDESGIPASGNIGRFQYTGQAWLPELGMYYYKARIYSPTLGRFMQTDPLGYGPGMNLYAYASNDPVNRSDPAGTDDILVVGGCGYDCTSYSPGDFTGWGSSSLDFSSLGFDLSTAIIAKAPPAPKLTEIVVTGTRGRSPGTVDALLPTPVPLNAAAEQGDSCLNPQSCIVVTGYRPIPRDGHRPLTPDDLGPGINVIALQGEIGIYKKNLNIWIKYIEGRGVLYQGISRAVQIARENNLSYVNITSTIANDKLNSILLAPDPRLFSQYPGTSVSFFNEMTLIRIPVR